MGMVMAKYKWQRDIHVTKGSLFADAAKNRHERCCRYTTTAPHHSDCRRAHSVDVTECAHRQSEQQGAVSVYLQHRSARSMTHHTVRSVYRHGPKMEWCQSLRGLTARVHCTHAASGHHVRPMSGQDRPGGRSRRPQRTDWTEVANSISENERSRIAATYT